MRNQEQISTDTDLRTALKHGCDRLDILEESNKLLFSKLQAGDFAHLPALVAQRNLLESQLIKFNKNFLKLIPDTSEGPAKKIDESVLNVARKFREKALHLSEFYLVLFEIIENGQKNVLRRLKETRLRSKMLRSYDANSFVNAEDHFAYMNKGKESK